jgi:hypothetical protein
MKYNNERIIFEIPSISNQWIFTAIVSFDEMQNVFHVKENTSQQQGMYLGKVTIFHTIRGSVHSFDITCVDFTTKDYVFIDIIRPVFKKYCINNNIFLNFDSINNE